MTSTPTDEQITAHLAAGGEWLWLPTDGGDLVLWLIGEDAHEDMGVASWDGDGWHSHASIDDIRDGSDGIINGRPGHWGRIDWMGEDDHGPPGRRTVQGTLPGPLPPGDLCPCHALPPISRLVSGAADSAAAASAALPRRTA